MVFFSKQHGSTSTEVFIRERIFDLLNRQWPVFHPVFKLPPVGYIMAYGYATEGVVKIPCLFSIYFII